MAMLAEKKRRTKWGLNLTGNDWAKDENKFGQKMLEKMGWTPGSGIGPRGQGPAEIIKLKVKNDTLGLGMKQDDKEIWTKNLANFDSLLAELNGAPAEDNKDQLALPSLEEKSKTSRARVHYHKFTRGKDLSKYSSKDLNSILPLHAVKKEEEEEYKSEKNMYAYFNTKMNNPYKEDNTDSSLSNATVNKSKQDKNSDPFSVCQPQEVACYNYCVSNNLDVIDEYDKSVMKKKRKNNGHTKYTQNEGCLGSNTDFKEGSVENSGATSDRKTDFPKKKKRKNKGCGEQTDYCLESRTDLVDEGADNRNRNTCITIDSRLVSSKKKGTGCGENNQHDDCLGNRTELNENKDVNGDITSDQPVSSKKKKKRKNEVEDSPDANYNNTNVEVKENVSSEVVSKKKKKRTKETFEGNVPLTVNNEVDHECSDIAFKKKKKHKKCKTELNELL